MLLHAGLDLVVLDCSRVIYGAGVLVCVLDSLAMPNLIHLRVVLVIWVGSLVLDSLMRVAVMV